MHKHSLCCWPVSIHPSATFVYCIQMVEDIIKLLSRPGSHMILVFLYQTVVPSSKENSFSRAQNAREGKICDFLTEIAVLSRKRYEIGSWLLWNVNR